MTLRAIKRVVTGHDAAGKAVMCMVGAAPTTVEIAAIPGTVFHEMWNTAGTPAAVDSGPDVTLKPLSLKPPANGSVIRIVDIPPDTVEFLAHGAARMHSAFSQIGDAAASTVHAHSAHPLMHRTESVDYGIVIEGQVTLILDDTETTLEPGDVVIQRGTNHAWANRTGRTARMAFILLDGKYDADTRSALQTRR
jgi:mannose-6-phosphate isomerase-like protein (cupin superfamily)